MLLNSGGKRCQRLPNVLVRLRSLTGACSLAGLRLGLRSDLVCGVFVIGLKTPPVEGFRAPGVALISTTCQRLGKCASAHPGTYRARCRRAAKRLRQVDLIEKKQAVVAKQSGMDWAHAVRNPIPAEQEARSTWSTVEMAISGRSGLRARGSSRWMPPLSNATSRSPAPRPKACKACRTSHQSSSLAAATCAEV